MIEKGFDVDYISVTRRLLSENENICILEHSHTNKIGDIVRVYSYEGEVKNVIYDANTDTIYYYTDIVVSEKTKVTDEEIANAKQKALIKFKELFDKSMKEIEERKRMNNE